MSEIFVDTNYWVALLLPDDELHEIVLDFTLHLSHDTRFVTSELVMVEFLNHVSDIDSIVRRDAMKVWNGLLTNPAVTIVHASHAMVESARLHYDKFFDKKWSLTDCSSFRIMSERKIHDALTHDHHFEQAGFRALLRK